MLKKPQKTDGIADKRLLPPKILPLLETMAFAHTKFKNKETWEIVYLLDRAVEWGVRTRVSDRMKVTLQFQEKKGGHKTL